jgi:tetratricopeptide (TPR) repeat protein
MYDNYSQPLMNVAQALPESGQEPPPMPPTASQAFDAARDAFKRGDYKTALVQTEVALKDFPNDPVMHEFRALTLFAMGQYRQASAIVHSLLASGPGWDWTTMSSLYANPDTYGTQLAALEKEAAAKPEDPSMQFLLAYHFMTIGNAEAAKGALANAKKLLPNDPVIAQLSQAAGVAVAQTPPMDPPPATNVNLDITGAWTATRADGGKIAMNTTKEGAFTWSVTDKSGKKESSDGDFKLEDDLLILERKSGGALTGRITPLAENKFLFKVIGGDPGDPGLTFAK